MTRSTFATVLLASLFGTTAAQAAPGLKCQAIHERLTPDNQLARAAVDLQTIFQTKGMIAMEAELDGHAFSLRGDPEGNEFLLFVTQAPDYTRGVVANASFNGSGEMRVAMVDGTTVHKLSCTRVAN